MLMRCFARRFHASQSSAAVEKSLLAELRKKTGYTFTNCKRALELHNNNIGEAEHWLKEQAQQMGWAKATKLEGRQTKQGLIAVAVENNMGALIELNCETDFVARNEVFQGMAEKAAGAVLRFTKNSNSSAALSKMWLNVNQLQQLNASDGKSLGDHLALTIGQLGENASLRRAFCFKSDANVYITGYAHPIGLKRNSVLLGRFGGLLAFTPVTVRDDVDFKEVADNICKHVVGMDPKKVGTVDDEPAKDSDEETCLIHQQYLLDNSVLVKDILAEGAIEIIDFKRFECGESEEDVEKKLLDKIGTCQ